MRPHLYVLDGRTPRAVRDVHEWAQARRATELDGWRVAFTDLRRCNVSTVFLGVDHALSGPPVLFETMVFANTEKSSDMDGVGEQRRYCTWDDAARGHEEMVAAMRRQELRVVGGTEHEGEAE